MKKLILLIIFICFYSFNFHSQNEQNSNNYYKWFDSVINVSNTSLLNGINFKEEYRTIEDNNQYFLTKQFLPGNVVYDGQSYYDIPMKYDIHNNELIIRLTDEKGHYLVIQLTKKHIENFKIDNHKFINADQLKLDIPVFSREGFYEVLFHNSNLSLFKKHIRDKRERLGDKFSYIEFVYKSKFLIKHNNKISNIRSKKDLIRLLPEQKKAINAFYDKNRVLRKSNYDTFLINLLKHLN
ncbi:hypothetical protein [Flavivirga eckloniae]|uniref:Uncharacterized protein n=1 Tax=Flavivirga eckloniae TaxID=1803846 RepID=A0A2K9PWM8_9FLAO|nr:hypothetical protein [Flavivirga eckloniae]AUP81469.1 hypothetical protein C1H87_23205 [Flavivirga eckloniae]